MISLLYYQETLTAEGGVADAGSKLLFGAILYLLSHT